MPGTPGHFDLSEIAQWDRKRRTATTVDTTITEARRRCTLAQAERHELKLAKERGEMVSIEENERMQRDIAHTVIRELDTWIAQLPLEIAMKNSTEVREALKKRASEFRLKLSGGDGQESGE